MNTTAEPLTIGIFEDNPIVVEGLSSYLENRSKYDFKVVFASAHPDEFLSLLKSKQPDVLIVDIIAEQVVGLEIFEQIFAHNPNITVLAYSNVKSQRIIKSLITLGVSAYLPKTAVLSIFDEAFDSIFMDRKMFLPPQLAHISRQKTLPIVLTNTEKQVVGLLIDGFSTKEIASKLFVSVNTINFHKKNLFEKFKVNNIASFVKEVIQQGYSGGIHY